jgi:hypothetical protein
LLRRKCPAFLLKNGGTNRLPFLMSMAISRRDLSQARISVDKLLDCLEGLVDAEPVPRHVRRLILLSKMCPRDCVRYNIKGKNDPLQFVFNNDSSCNLGLR